MIFEDILKLLKDSNVDFELSEHKAVTTSEEAAKIRGVELKTGAKAMVAKYKEGFLLLVLPGDQKINWKKLKNELNLKDLSLASTEEAEKVTTCKRGSVPPFGNLMGIKTILDPLLLENQQINFNPGSLTHSIQMSSKDLVVLVKPQVISFVTYVDNDPKGSII